MKKLKNLFYNLLLLTVCMATSVLAACSDDEDNSGTNTNFAVSAEMVEMPLEGGVTYLYVRSGAKATVASDQTWCQVSEEASSSAVSHRFKIEVNPNADTDDREATLTVAAGANTQSVKVKQTAAWGLIVESVEPIEVPAAGGSVVVKLKANGSYTTTMQDGVNWLTAVNSRSPMSECVHTYQVDANFGPDRTASITFALEGITQTVTVKQLGATQSSDMSHTAKEIAAQMLPGWNLGNTLEAGSSSNNDKNAGVSTEVSWQKTKTTKQLIDFVKAQGFKSVRIPCSWVMGHITDAANATIDPTWMNRVQEIVDYCIANDLYVVLNDHYDGGWLEESFGDVSDAAVTKNCNKLAKIWKQIANHFKNYDEHLLFAGLNEPNQSQYSGEMTAAQMKALVKYEQTFIDAVRQTGGNNAKRTLVVQGPKTNISETLKLFKGSNFPVDNVAERLMVEVHYYEPWQFAGLTEDGSGSYIQHYYWGADNHVAGSNRNAESKYEESYVKKLFGQLKAQYVDNNIPVVIGEYGAQWRDMSAVGGDQAKHDASITAYFTTINEQGARCGIVPFVWDINSCQKPTMTVIDRAKLAVYCTPAMEGILEGVRAGKQ